MNQVEQMRDMCAEISKSYNNVENGLAGILALKIFEEIMALPLPEVAVQKPVGYVLSGVTHPTDNLFMVRSYSIKVGDYLYAAPVQPSPTTLSDEQIIQIARDVGIHTRIGGGFIVFARALLGEVESHAEQVTSQFGDAYQGAREDMQIWKKRALEAEEILRNQSATFKGEIGLAIGESVLSLKAENAALKVKLEAESLIATDYANRLYHWIGKYDELKAKLAEPKVWKDLSGMEIHMLMVDSLNRKAAIKNVITADRELNRE